MPANARRKPSKVVSIQAARKRSYKSPTASMQAKTLAKAYRQGMVWDDDEVSLLVNGIEKDQTTYEMALALGRSYYGVAGARAHVAFALRHKKAIWKR
jgi:hypothetical protein